MVCHSLIVSGTEVKFTCTCISDHARDDAAYSSSTAAIASVVRDVRIRSACPEVTQDARAVFQGYRTVDLVDDDGLGRAAW